MDHYIYGTPDIYLFVIFGCISIAVSIVFIWIMKEVLKRQLRYKNNAAVGNISALISLIFGVLAGLTALYLINNITYTADAVQREANAVANLYRESSWLKEPTQGKMKKILKQYLYNVIHNEWPLMKNGKHINKDDNILIDNFSAELHQYSLSNTADQMMLSDMIIEIKNWYNAREQRIHMSYSALNPDMWLVLLIGTILTIVINYLYRMNTRLHIITVSAAALMASSMLFLLVTLDRPFQGEFVIDPGAFQVLLTYIGHL